MLTPEQIANRKNIIGGSDIAAIMGMSPWKSPLKLWAEKTGKIQPDDLSDNESVECGIELEAWVANWFSKKTGFKIKIDLRDFIHPVYPYMVGHIDRWILKEDAILEVKTTSAFMAQAWLGEEIPHDYVLQLNWYQGILFRLGKRTEKQVGYIAVLIGGQKRRQKKIDFSLKLFEKQEAAAKDFWENYVLANKAPLAESGDEDTLAALFADVKDQILSLDGRDEEVLNNLIEELSGGEEQEKLVKEEISRIKNQIRQMLGESESAVTSRHGVTWKNQRVPPFIDVDRMRRDEVYEKYEIFNQARVLRHKLLQKKG